MYSDKKWGELPDGRSADLIILRSEAGAAAEISNYGGIVRSIVIPMADGTYREAVKGYESIEEYLADTAAMGRTIGPYANRIRGGSFTLDGVEYRLEKNDRGNTTHGGSRGWHSQLFAHSRSGDDLLLTRRSPDGEGGFPGNVDVSVRFAWRDDMTLEITYEAFTDRATVISMTNHSYFNLGVENTILTHRLRLRADFYTPLDDAQIPTGEIVPVRGTPFDFTVTREIGRAYDGNFVIAGGDGPAATLTAPDGKLEMDLYTDKPAVQLYTGTYVPPPHGAFCGVCLETQHFPDAPNKPNFPSPVVCPGRPYRSATAFAFRGGG